MTGAGSANSGRATATFSRSKGSAYLIPTTVLGFEAVETVSVLCSINLDDEFRRNDGPVPIGREMQFAAWLPANPGMVRRASSKHEMINLENQVPKLHTPTRSIKAIVPLPLTSSQVRQIPRRQSSTALHPALHAKAASRR